MYLTQEIILQHGRSSPYKGEIKNPTVSAEVENALCGDVLKMDIRIDQGEIIDIVFSGEGCLISQAAASLLIDEIKRVKNLKKVQKFDKNTVLKLLGIKLTTSRMQCALLSLQVLSKAFQSLRNFSMPASVKS